MLGIKTKKDKKIEELQKEINRQKTLLNSSIFRCETVDTKTFYSEFVLPYEALTTITEKHIKSVLATKMVDVLKENMEIEHTVDKQLVIYRAKLEILKRSE